MLRMAVTAAQARVIVHQRTMHRCRIAHLLAHLGVAGDTSIRHGRRVPGRDMTGFTVSARFGMGCYTTQGSHAVSAQWSRVIHQSAARVRVARDHERRDQRRKYTYRRETADSPILHAPSHSVFCGLNIHLYQNIQQALRTIHIPPIGGGMTSAAIGAVLTVVLIFMARSTIARRPLIHTVAVALLTFQIPMLPGQGKGSIVVVKGGISPARRIVACAAIRPKLAVMCIPGGMTGETIRRRALEYSIRMA